jgi:hypothetical protein
MTLVAACAMTFVFALITSAASAETEGEAIVTAAQGIQSHSYPQQSFSSAQYVYCFDGGTTAGATAGGPDHHPEGSYSNCNDIGRVGFDCRGLALYSVYQGTGGAVTLPTSTAQAQYSDASSYGGSYISLLSVQPGDLVFLGSSSGNVEHVGIVVSGTGTSANIVSAINEEDGITTHTVHWFEGGFSWVGAVAILGVGSGRGGREPDGSFIKVTGAPAIYRVIGGAPVHVDSCAPLGGCPGLVEVPSLDSYATEPENGAFIRMANGPVAGLVARVVGGVPLGLTTCEGMESEGCNDAINLDEGGFNEYAAAHQVIANGTFVRVADGPKAGLIGRVVGGVLLGLVTCEGMEGEGCNTAVNVAENAYDYYASEYHTIANGTFVRVADGPKAGLIGRVVGDVLLGLTTCEGMEGEGCDNAVNLAENAYLYYASEYNTIANGTFVRVGDGPRAGLIGRVVGGVLLGFATCEGMEGEGCDNAVNVAENAYLYYASEYDMIANGTFVRIADGPKAGLIARAAGGTLLGLTTCVPLEGCPGQVNVAENAFTYYAAEHPQPANGTLVEGVPSDTYWLFTNGEREPVSAGAGAIAIDDGSLALYPIKAPSSGNPGAGSTGTGTTSTPDASTGGGSTTSSPGKGGVLASDTARPLTRTQKLAKAVRACDKLRSKHKRTVCIAAARRHYRQPKRRNANVRGSLRIHDGRCRGAVVGRLASSALACAVGFCGTRRNRVVCRADRLAIEDAGESSLTPSLAYLASMPASDTVVESVPSDSFWQFENGCRETTSSTTTAIAVNDATLNAEPECTSGGSTSTAGPYSSSPGAGTPGSTSQGSSSSHATAGQPPHGVLATKTSRRATPTRYLGHSQSAARSRIIANARSVKPPRGATTTANSGSPAGTR